MLLFVKLLILQVVFVACSEATDTSPILTKIVEQSNAAASLEKEDIEAVVKSSLLAASVEKQVVENLASNVSKVSTLPNDIKNALKQGKGSCSVGGCAALREKPMEIKESPLMDAKKPLIFVSASMPIASLKKIAYQASKQNAILVVRGMVKGSMVETARLVDEIDHPLEIDPKLFERFKITNVPVFMVYSNNAWHKVSGNVNLDFALEKANNQPESVSESGKLVP